MSQPDPDARRQAVEALSDAKVEALQTELLALAANDEDPSVRRACVARLASIAGLGELLDDPVIAEAAAQRIAELIGSDTGNPLALHPLVIKLRLSSVAPDAARELLKEVQEESQLIDLAISTRGELREVILARLSTATALTEMEHQTRGRDKTLNRYARERLETIKAARHETDQTRARLLELAETLERHQRINERIDDDRNARQRLDALLREFDRTEARFDELGERLREIGEAPEPVDGARQQVAQLRTRLAAEPSQGTPADAPLGTPTPDPFPDLVTRFQALGESMEQGHDFAEIARRRQALTDQWLAAADLMPPEPAEHEVFEAVSHAFRELADSVDRVGSDPWAGAGMPPLAPAFPDDPEKLQTLWQQVNERRRALKQGQRLIRQIAWPEWAKPGADYAELLLGVNRMEQELARADDHERSLHARLEAQIATLTDQIEAGSVKSAFATLSEARRLSKSLPAATVADLVKTLNHEAARLAELRDWQTFVTTPKREALCETIQALVDEPLDPADQADRIKRLRSDWIELGPVTRSEDRKLADRFNALAEQAFEPCRAYFAEQAELRKANLAERRRICEQLESYLAHTDWASADKKAAEQILHTARNEWRRFHPVDRNPGRRVEERFEKLQARLHELVKAEWEANLALKRAIVDEAKALPEHTAEVAERIDRAKALQRRWRDVGITPRGPDQQLWREFRAACDAVFAARDEARAKSDQETRAAVDAGFELIGEMEAVVTSASASDADEAVLRGFRKRLADLPFLPDRTHREVQRRFDELARTYAGLLQDQARDAERTRLKQLKSWDESVSAGEAASRAGGNSPELSLPDPLFDPRLASVGEPVPEEALRKLAIRAELLAGIESPSGDRDLRLQIQVDQLNSGMGQQRIEPDPLELAKAWCVLGPKHEGCDELRGRMFAALARAMED